MAKYCVMKHALIFPIILLMSVAITFYSCCLFKKSHNISDTKPISSESSNCDYGIQIFNRQAAGAVMSDINSIYSKRGSIPEDMRRLYPAAKNAWNRALNHVQSNYTSGYTEPTLDGLTIETIKDWRNKNLEGYQTFFLLLAEYMYGKYPEETHDVLNKTGWIEKADAKKRLDAYVKVMLNSNCYSTNSQSIKQQLNPVLLPDSIEACYR